MAISYGCFKASCMVKTFWFVRKTSIKVPFVDLTQVMSAINFFMENVPHKSDRWLPLYFFLFDVSICLSRQQWECFHITLLRDSRYLKVQWKNYLYFYHIEVDKLSTFLNIMTSRLFYYYGSSSLFLMIPWLVHVMFTGRVFYKKRFDSYK